MQADSTGAARHRAPIQTDGQERVRGAADVHTAAGELPRFASPGQRDAWIFDRIAQGQTIAELARLFAVSRQRVSSIAAREAARRQRLERLKAAVREEARSIPVDLLLELPLRVRNALELGGFKTAEDIAKAAPARVGRVPTLGVTGLRQVAKTLQDLGLAGPEWVALDARAARAIARGRR